MYIYILRRLMDVVRRKRPEKLKTNCWFLRHDNVPEHRSILVKNFLAKKNVTTLELPPYSPDLTGADFYLFPRLNSVLRGRLFCDPTDIIKNVTEELKRLSQNGLYSKQLYSP